MSDGREVVVLPLVRFDAAEFRRLASSGFVSDVKYRVHKTESDENFSLTLELVPAAGPIAKHYGDVDPDLLAHYEAVVLQGCSFGAYVGRRCVGMAVAEPREWNASLWVWELHVSANCRGLGIGRKLTDALESAARSRRLRTIVCETQTTNVPAVRFYRSVGFQIEGIDVSYYSNDDYPDGEIALFMKRRVDPRGPQKNNPPRGGPFGPDYA